MEPHKQRFFSMSNQLKMENPAGADKKQALLVTNRAITAMQSCFLTLSIRF
jgi:hypothetical protein